MKKALYVDCCIRGSESRTARLAEAFLAALPEEYAVTHLNLMQEGLQPLTGDFFHGRQELLTAGDRSHPRFRYAYQIAEADLIVMAAPFWDMSFPSLLKIYIENTAVDGITFRGGENGLEGMCRAKQLVFLTTRGGFYADAPELEQATPYLKAIQKFYGIPQFACIAADGLDVVGFDGASELHKACGEAAALACTL